MKRVVVSVVVAALSLAVVACGDDTATDEETSTKDLKSASAGSSGGGSSGSSGSSGGGKTLSSFPASGKATFYDATGRGSCSYDATPNDLDVVAMAMPEYNESAACGTCLEVKGPKGTIKVRVVDRCPGCEAKDVNLDLSASAFAKLADPVKGKIDITYAAVPCSVTGNLAYHFKDGSSKWWTAIQVRNHKVPVAKLEYKKDGAWVEIERLDYNYFVVKKGVGDQPDGLQVRVTSTDGQTLEDTLPGQIPADKTIQGKTQFD